jgi:UDP-N-acetylglucosamine 2-epimerase
VESEAALTDRVKELLDDKELYQRTSAICRSYVEANRGATGKIMQFLNGES